MKETEAFVPSSLTVVSAGALSEPNCEQHLSTSSAVGGPSCMAVNIDDGDKGAASVTLEVRV